MFNEEPDRQCFESAENIFFIRKKLIYYFGERGRDVIMKQAPGPKEIIWANLKNQSGKKWRLFVGWGLTAVFLFLTFVAFFFINMFKASLIVSSSFDVVAGKTSAATQTHATLARVVAWGTFICIILFNKFVMGTVLHHLTDMENHDDRADY